MFSIHNTTEVKSKTAMMLLWREEFRSHEVPMMGLGDFISKMRSFTIRYTLALASYMT